MRNEVNDIRIFVKNHDKWNYEPYREVDIETIIDDSVPLYKSKNKYPGEKEPVEVDSEGFVTPKKRRKSYSPEVHNKKKRIISPIKLCNYLFGFLSGTTTTPKQSLYHENEEEIPPNTQDMLEVEEEVLQLAANEAEENSN